MKDKYRLILASDVSTRDGLALELVEVDTGFRLAEVFQDDESGERSVSISRDRSIPLADFEWFLRQAREQL